MVHGVHLEWLEVEAAAVALEASVASHIEAHGEQWHQCGRGRGVCMGVGVVCQFSLLEDWGVIG